MLEKIVCSSENLWNFRSRSEKNVMCACLHAKSKVGKR